MASVLGALDAAPASAWLNVPAPLTAEALRGRVVLVGFWTYSCVNWLRTLPYLSAWHARYDDLVVLGVHAPEFGFEHDLANVRHAVDALGVDYPVVKDDAFAIWRAFENHYWPAVYLLDADGRLAFRHFGEGAYAETERAIQVALGHAGEPLATEAVVADGPALAADWDALRTPETYVGAARGERRAEDGAADALALNQWSLTGDWSIGPESATLDEGPGSIAFRYAGRDLNLVLAPPADGRSAPFTITVDGARPGDLAGVDVPPSGDGEIDAPRMFQLIRAPGPVVERTVEVTLADAGVSAYVFTFG